MLDLDADTAFIFEDMGVPVVSGSESGFAFFEQVTETVLDDMVSDTNPTLQMRTATLPSLVQGATITVDSIAYRVRRIDLVDDGKSKRVTLKAAA